MSYFVKIVMLSVVFGPFLLAEELNLSGVYVVPTSDKNLVSEAQFKVTQYKVIEPNSVEPVIQFTLPIELTGVENKLEFKRAMLIDASDKSALYLSTSGSALCYGAWKVLKCFFKFKDLEMDQPKAIEILRTSFRGKQLIQKTSLLRAFDGEPVGILQIAAPK